MGAESSSSPENKPNNGTNSCPMGFKTPKEQVNSCPIREGTVPKDALSKSAAWSTSQMRGVDPTNMMPPPNQLPAPGQNIPLSTDREVSNIPRASESADDKWVYPSEQMFYNAMIRKGWKVEKDELTPSVMSSILKVLCLFLMSLHCF